MLAREERLSRPLRQAYLTNTGHTSPVISLNNKTLRAVVDRGSGHTLILESAAENLGAEINTTRNIPGLQGVTGTPLRVIGMVWLEVRLGNDHTHRQWVPGVPNRYLDVELLLGTDIIRKSHFQWNGKADQITWGNATYVVGHIKRQRSKVERIQSIPSSPIHGNSNRSSNMNINLIKPVVMEPYSSNFVPLQVKGTPNDTILVHPHLSVCHTSLPLLTKVNTHQVIWFPLSNTTGSKRGKSRNMSRYI